MKQILLILLACCMQVPCFSQINLKSFLSTDDKLHNKSNSKYYDTGIKSHKVLKGNIKKGNGTLLITYDKGRSEGHEARYDVFVKGNFLNKQLNGHGEVCVIRNQDVYSLTDKLQTHSGNLVDFFENEGIEVMQAYVGEFEENMYLSGCYSFIGTTKIHAQDEKQLIHLELLNIVKDEVNDGKFKYMLHGSAMDLKATRRKGLGETDSLVILDYSNGEKHVIKNDFKNMRYSDNISSIDGPFLRFETWNKTYMGKMGWKRIYQNEKCEITLEGKTYRKDKPIFFIPKYEEEHNWNGGLFYGEIVNGNPKKHGIFISDSIYYEGEFNDKGEFHGDGFYADIRKEKSDFGSGYTFLNDEYFIGRFENNKFVSGEIDLLTYSTISNFRGDFESDDIAPFNTSNREKGSLSYHYSENLAQFALNGIGEKNLFRINFLSGVVEENKYYARGYFLNHKLHGKGEKLTTDKNFKDDFVYGVFENGVLGEESINLQAREYGRKRDSMELRALEIADYSPGTFILKGDDVYYVNEIFLSGEIEYLRFPLFYNFKSDESPIIYSWGRNKLMGYPNFSYGTRYYFEGDGSYEEIDLVYCKKCKGIGKIQESQEITTTKTTTKKVGTEVYHKGDYYIGTRDKFETSTHTSSETHMVTNKCLVCGGKGCLANVLIKGNE